MSFFYVRNAAEAINYFQILFLYFCENWERSFSRMRKFGTEKDKEILELLKKAPEQGFRMLFDVYHMSLCVYAVQLTDSFELAEDIVQDFFVSLWEKKYYLQIDSNLCSYLYSSVHHAALAVLRKKNLISMEELSGIPVEIPQEVELEREELERRERELMRKLEQLPRQELAAVKAVILENKKCAEAASELGMSVNTLKTHLARALKKLRKKYNLFLLFYSF